MQVLTRAEWYGQLLEVVKVPHPLRYFPLQLTVLPRALTEDLVDERRDRSRNKCISTPGSDDLAGVAYK
jgi:hypothetical protein